MREWGWGVWRGEKGGGQFVREREGGGGVGGGWGGGGDDKGGVGGGAPVGEVGWQDMEGVRRRERWRVRCGRRG